MMSSFKRTARFGSIARKEIGIGLLFLPLALSSNLALPFFVGNIIDLVVGPVTSLGEQSGDLAEDFFGGLTQLQTMVGGLVGISIFGAGASVFRSYYINLGSVATLIIFSHQRPYQRV